MGLTQLTPATAEHFGVAHPFYIHENIRGGVAYPAELIGAFRGDLRLVTSAYVAGERPVMARGVDYSSPEVSCTYAARGGAISRRIEATRREVTMNWKRFAVTILMVGAILMP
jgi:soluble lytic murein transglycosylase-like protein